MKQASAHRKKKAGQNKILKAEREAQKQELTEWIRLRNRAQFYEEAGMKCEMRPERSPLPLFGLEVDGVPLNELWEKDPAKAYVAWLGPAGRAKWTRELRKRYKAAQARLMHCLNGDHLETFSTLLATSGPLLLAKDPLNPGVVLSALDRLWRDQRDQRELSEQDRSVLHVAEELHFYDLSTDARPSLAEGGGLWEMTDEELRTLVALTDTEILEARRRGRQRIREILRAVGEAFAWEGAGRPAELPGEEKPKSEREAVSRTNAVRGMLSDYDDEKGAERSAEQAYKNVVTAFVVRPRMKARERKISALRKFDQEIVKKDPCLVPLVGRKIWLLLLDGQEP